MDKDKKSHGPSGLPSDPRSSGVEDSHRKQSPEMRRAKPTLDPIAAALEAAERLTADTDAIQAAEDAVHDIAPEHLGANDPSGGEPNHDDASVICRACGYPIRAGNKFCSRCGVIVDTNDSRFSGFAEPRRPRPIALHPNPFLDPEPEDEFTPSMPRSAMERHPSPHSAAPNEMHHYHHHYHHHYFPGGYEGTGPGASSGASRPSDPAREIERLRPTAALRGDMSRAEAAVRRITQEWVLACNTKHLDDLMELYTADALLLRSNVPPVRGAAAVREFFFGALDSGLGEVEVEPLRVEIVGDMAYEAGRCKALVPSATGKRREERGKYLWVCARQSNGEWRLAVDSWSSDLMLTTLESDIPAGGGVKTSQPRKS